MQGLVWELNILIALENSLHSYRKEKEKGKNRERKKEKKKGRKKKKRKKKEKKKKIRKRGKTLHPFTVRTCVFSVFMKDVCVVVL